VTLTFDPELYSTSDVIHLNSVHKHLSEIEYSTAELIDDLARFCRAILWGGVWGTTDKRVLGKFCTF